MREDRENRERVTRRGGTRLFGRTSDRGSDPGRERIHAFDTEDATEARDRGDRDHRRYEGREDRRYDDRDRRRYEDRDDRGYDDRDDRRHDDRDDRRYDDREGRRYEDRHDRRYDDRDGRRYEDREDRRYDDRDRRRYDDRDDRRYDDRDRRYDDRDERRDERRDDREQSRRTQPPRQPSGSHARRGKRSGGDTTLFVHQVVPYFLFWVALFAAVSFVLRDICRLDSTAGLFGNALADFLCGLFGAAAYFLPLFGVVIALRWRRFVKEGILGKKLFLSVSFLLLLSGIIHVFQDSDRGMRVLEAGTLYGNGMARAGGGFFGGFVGEWLGFCLRLPGTIILAIPLLIIIGIYLVGMTPVGLWQRVAYKVNLARQQGQERRAARTGAVTVADADKTAEADTMEEAGKPAVPGWREPRPLAKPTTTYDFHEEEPDVTIPGRKEEQAERDAARRERVRQAAAFAAEPTPATPEPDEEPDVVDIPDDEPETEETHADAAAILRQAGQAENDSAQLESLLNSVLQDTGTVSRPASTAAPAAPADAASAEAKKEPPSGSYYAPFALPVRPEPKRDRSEKDDAHIVIQPHEETTDEPRTDAPAASDASAGTRQTPPDQTISAPTTDEENLGSRGDEWRFQHAAPRREEPARPATGAAAYRWDVPVTESTETAGHLTREASVAPSATPVSEPPASRSAFAFDDSGAATDAPSDAYSWKKEEQPAPIAPAQNAEWGSRSSQSAPKSGEWEKPPVSPAPQSDEWGNRPSRPAPQSSEWEKPPVSPAQQSDEWGNRPSRPAPQSSEWEKPPVSPAQQNDEWSSRSSQSVSHYNDRVENPARREDDWIDNTAGAVSSVSEPVMAERPAREKREPRPADAFGRRTTNPFSHPTDPTVYMPPTAPVRPTRDEWGQRPAEPVRTVTEPVTAAAPPPSHPFALPSADLLVEDTVAKETDNTQEIEEKIAILKDTLASFNIAVRDEVTCSRGPTITRYELRPEQGVSVRSVINRIDDISLNLAAAVRIEAPIPGKPAIGIEVPNAHRETVFMRTMLESDAFRNSKKLYEVPLGVSVGGDVALCNLIAMPHLLVAGTTGSGKSVCINTILISLLFKTTPEDLRLILIDPKQVEFSLYEHMPHLYLPIVTDMKRAVGVLACAVQEMERRYSLIRDVGARDIDGYNEAVKNDPEREHLPRIIIVIDEFADLKMSATNNDVETFTCRIAQKARAAGMHLIIGTQRPSVNVITGALKTNIPSRIAFTVMQQVDSRTILDMNGAETLTGRGDMLYMPTGCPKPMRVQGAYVSDAEIARVVTYVRNHNDPVQYNRTFMDQLEAEVARAEKANRADTDDFDEGDGEDDGEDNKFIEAVRLAVETDKVATSLLQRRLGVGYGRAAKIIDRMEELGLVSAPEGNKARKVLPAAQSYLNHMAMGDDSDDGMDGFDDYR